MTYLSSSNSSVNGSLGLFLGNTPKDFNDTSIGGGVPFDFPPPPGGGGMSVGNLFNNIAEIQQLHALQKALHNLVAVLFESLVNRSGESESSTNHVIDVLQPSDTITSLSKWVGTFFTSATSLETTSPLSKGSSFRDPLSIYDLLGSKGIPNSPIERTVYMFRRRAPPTAAESFLSFGFPVLRVTPTEPEDIPTDQAAAGAGAERRGDSGIYGFDTTIGGRYSGIFVDESGHIRPPSERFGFGEAATADPGSTRTSTLEPIDEASEQKILKRGETVSQLIQDLGGVEAGEVIIRDIAHWLNRDTAAVTKVVELFGFNSELISSGKEAFRVSILEKAGVSSETIPEFYAAATTLGFNFKNIATLRKSCLGLIQSDNLFSFQTLLALEKLIDPSDLNLNEQEVEGLKAVVQDLVKQVLVADIIAYYTKIIEEGGKCADSKVFIHLLKNEKFKASFERLQNLQIETQKQVELKSRMEHLQATQSSELDLAVKQFTTKYQQREKPELLKEIYGGTGGSKPAEAGKKMTVDGVARALLVNKDDEFGKKLQELIEQLKKVHSTQQKDLESEYEA